MAGDPNGETLLKKWSNFPGKQIRYVPNADVDTVRSIDRGIIFLMAFWSGYAIDSFVKLTNVLHQLKAADLSLTVVDVDGSQELEQFPEFQDKLMLGYGQAAWVRNGKIIFASEAGRSDTENYQRFSVALLWGHEAIEPTFPQIPDSIEWLAPWETLPSSGEGFVRELRNELSYQHVLFGIPVTAIAHRVDCDDVLFTTLDPTKPLAVVHLSWIGKVEHNPTWPGTTIYDSWQDWIERCMKHDHED